MATPQIAGDSRRIVHANRAHDEIPFERIPGLAYTHEERVAAALEALEDYRAGRCISHEEMGKRIASVRASVDDYRATGIAFTTEELRARHPRI
jgi:uncharacterized protein Yka (UPF0111/DUF47 family)